jgi:15-cis-phytoene synthase
MNPPALVDLVASALAEPERRARPAPCGVRLALDHVHRGLRGAAARAEALGLPVPPLGGQLFRPLAALAGAHAAGHEPDDRLWLAALAIQLAHEASLLHDDVIDGAAIRRGEPTMAASHGVARALIDGDHLLTAAYRVAGETGSVVFMRLFAAAVERTVAGEKRQASLRGSGLDWDTYHAVVAGKSGELFGCALAAAAALNGGPTDRWVEVGRRVGSAYQMVDDLLDYCPAAAAGKAPLGDYRAGLWTWVRLEAADLPAGLAPDAIREHLFARRPGGSPMRRTLARLDAEMRDIEARIASLGNDQGVVAGLLASWRERSADAIRGEEHVLLRAEAASRLRRLTGGRDMAEASEVREYFAEHGRTFRFAAHLFPRQLRDQVATVYAFCRFTDDLVDRQDDLPPATRHTLLDAWRDAAWTAYRGTRTGIPILDRAMGEMAEHRVPFAYAADLIEGARMDLDSVTIATAEELQTYAYRVASVVGLWLTELVGVRDPGTLDRAAAMGHAMQITNILRDVGEDLARGRCYLPATLLAEHGLTSRDLESLRRSDGPIPDAYAAACEHLMGHAERQYAYAFEAPPGLPGYFRRPVAVAARAYAAIHDAIRRNGYDNLRHRAVTTLPEKLMEGLGGLRDLHAPARRRPLRPLPGALSLT